MGRDTQEFLWFCCKCTHFWSCSLYYTCINCHHRRGPCCTYKYVRKPGITPTQRASHPAWFTQRPRPLHLRTSLTQEDGPKKTSDDQALPGPGTASSHINAEVTPIGKPPYHHTSLGIQVDRHDGRYAILFKCLTL
jgi:hypothetical protein